MKKTIKIFCIIIFFVWLLSVVVNAAENMITKDKLKQELDKIIMADDWEDFFGDITDVKVTDDKITLKKSGRDYTILYSTSNNKITFSYSLNVEKGMQYPEYSERVCGDYKVLQLLLYSAIADNYKGEVFADPAGYYNLILVNNILNGSAQSTKYTVVASEDNKANMTGDDVILVSEFEDKIINIVDNQFKEKYTISDSNGINSFVCNLTRQNLTATSRKLGVELTIDTTADFSKIFEKSQEIYKNQKELAKEKSRYKVKLKVGQKVLVPWAKGIVVFASSFLDLDENNYVLELEGKAEGSTHGIIYTRTGGEESIYIEVEPNTESKPYDDYVLEHKETDEPNENKNNNNEKQDDKPASNPITEKPSTTPAVTEKKENDDENKPVTVIRVGFDDEVTKETVTATPAQSEDNTTAKTVLPKTGEKAGLILAILLVLGIGYTSYKKYSNMKEIK